MPHPNKPVRACICYPHTFRQLKRLAAERQWRRTEEIATEVGCGNGCGFCRPYLALMLQTGETEFEVLPPSLPAPPE